MTKKRLTEIEKQAITVWELIHRIERKHHYSIPQTALRAVRKATKNFLKNARNTRYDIKDQWNDPYLDRIERHLKQKDNDSDAVYLTWLQFQFHDFIHEFCQDHDPNDTENSQPYYAKMIEVLTK